MPWQLIFIAPEAELPEGELEASPPPRKPVSMTVQLEPGSIVVVGGGDEEDED